VVEIKREFLKNFMEKSNLIELTPIQLLNQWLNRVRRNQLAHRQSAKFFNYLNNLLGIPVIVLSTFVGTSIFSTLNQSVKNSIRIILGLISTSSAVLAALQTFLKFGERANQHSKAAANYGSTRRNIEQYIATKINDKDQPTFLNKIRDDMDHLSSDSPEVPEFIWNKVAAKINKMNLVVE